MQDSILANFNKELTKLRKDYNKLEADLAGSKSVAEVMKCQ